jgi:hypothetical protein
MNKIFNFKTLVSFSAIAIAGCAALFSVTGIGTLFAGAAVSAMVMAGALELGKLVGVSFLYRYWSEIPKALKSYMLVASIVLIGITSAGIYGYLSSAYAKVAAEPLKMNADIQIYNSQAQTLDEEIKRKTARLDQIISLRGQQENRIDNLIGKSTTGSNTAIRSAQNSLSELNRTATTLQREINQASAQRDSLKARSLTKEVEINTNSDIGTFVYISKAIGVELDTVVKWFILIIVLVFDPLSICLVLAYNFLQKREHVNQAPNKEIKTFAVYDEKPPEEPSNNNVIIEQPKQESPALDPNDPYPQYMTKEETVDVLERWWKRRNGVDINIF